MTPRKKLCVMRPVLFFTLSMASTLKEVDASSVGFERANISRENIHQYRRLRKENNHLKRIHVGDWRDAEEEGEVIHLIELQLEPKYTSDVDDLTLAKFDEIQPVQLQCQPNSCIESLDGFCENCQVSYCMTDIELTSEDPFKYSKFSDVVNTAHCDSQSTQWDVNEIHTELSVEDESNPECRSLPVQMAIFDLGPGTDSERVTNFLAGVNPANLVITDAQPIYEALMVCSDKRKEILRTESCSHENVVDLLQKTTYLTCRTCDPTFQQCILKFQSGASLEMETFQKAFPEAEVMFIYTDPILYMGSAVNPNHMEKAKCAHYKYNPTKAIEETALKKGKDISTLSVEEICAIEAHNIMESAIMEMGRTGKVTFIHADDALDKFEAIMMEDDFKNPVLPLDGTIVTEWKGKINSQKYEKMKEEKIDRATGDMIFAGDSYLGDFFDKAEEFGGEAMRKSHVG